MASLLYICLALALPLSIYSLTCTVCPFNMNPPENQNCTETCEGDICKIVVNRYFNGTNIAGCMMLREGDKFENKALCYRSEARTICACSTEDECNSPGTSLSDFEFTNEPFLENYQFMPQINPEPHHVVPVLGGSEDESTLTVQSAMTVFPSAGNPTASQPMEGSGMLFSSSPIPLMETTTMRRLNSGAANRDIEFTKTVGLQVGDNENATDSAPLANNNTGDSNNDNVVSSTQSSMGNMQSFVTGSGSVENAPLGTSTQSSASPNAQSVQSSAPLLESPASSTPDPDEVSGSNSQSINIFASLLTLTVAYFSL